MLMPLSLCAVQTYLDLDQKIKSLYLFLLRVKNIGAVNTPEKVIYLFIFEGEKRLRFIHRKIWYTGMPLGCH